MQSATRSSTVQTTALALLALMAALMISSAWDDTIIFDEEPHIAAGLSYLRRADYRFNPEHPPLMKDLAALPLLFLHLNEPWSDSSWEAGEAWDFGARLLYGSGNDANAIARVARAPMIVFTLAFGWFFFCWICRAFGSATALLALFFYTFSPTFLAHGRFVATDVGAAAGFFVATVAFLRVLRAPSRRNTVLAGLAMGFALLTKFSTILLAPIVVLLAVLWATAHRPSASTRPWLRWVRRKAGFVVAVRWRASPILKGLAQSTAVILIALLTVYAVYLPHTWNLPTDRQRADTERILIGRGVGHTPKDITIWASDKPLLRPWAAYWAGLFSTVQRSGNDAPRFFLGRVYTTGLPLYLPFVSLVKEPLALHLLAAIALIFALTGFRRSFAAREWFCSHFTEFAFLVAISVYWVASIKSGINIGVRHVLPAFPFLYVLVAIQITRLICWARERAAPRQQSFASTRLPSVILAVLLGWQAASVLHAHPSYLAYFNELAGGPEGGWRYVVDSNIDWGQDLQRLASFAEQRSIAELHLDYFGTASPHYYLKEKYRELTSCADPRRGWIAVSVTNYQHSRAKSECDYRRWLPIEKLVAKIGYSIFVFRVE